MPNDPRESQTAAGAAPGRFGALPAFFQLAYFDSPLPTAFKDRLFVHLSRFCEVRYCVARHVGFLMGLGRPEADAKADLSSIDDIMALLERPVPDAAALVQVLARLLHEVSLNDIPAPGTPAERDLFDALSALFIEPRHAPGVTAALRNAVGEAAFHPLMAYLAFVRAAHFWTETHPGLALEPDMLALLELHPTLKPLLLDAADARRIRDLHAMRDTVDELRASLRETEERQAFMLQLSDALRSLSYPAQVQQAAMRLLGERLGANRCHYAEAMTDEDTLLCGPCFARGVAPLEGVIHISDFAAPILDVFRQQRTLVIHDTAQEAAAHLDAFDAAQIRAVLAVPLVKDGRFVAVLAVHQARPRRWTGAEIRLTEEVAERCWAAVERAPAEAALRASEARLQLALHAAGMGTFVWYPEHDHVELDRPLRDLFGIASDEPANPARSLAGMIPPEDRPAHAHAVSHALDPANDGMLRSEHRIRRASDGAVRWLATLGRTQFAGEPPVAVSVTGVCSDITERKRVEERQAYLLKLSDALRPLGDATLIQAEAMRVLGEHFQVMRAQYCEMDADDEHLSSVSGWAGGEPLPPKTVRLDDFGPHLKLAFRAGGTLAVDDVAADPRIGATELAAYDALGFRAFIGVPLVKQGRFVALLGLYHATPRHWSEAEVALTEDTAERIWAAVERARVEAALREADRRKDEFLATLAHELRNPLAPISNALHLLRVASDRFPPERVHEMLDRQVKHMVRLLDDLLEVSRISRGVIELRRQRLDLAPVIDDAVEAGRPWIERGHHVLTVTLPAEPLVVLGDAMRLAQVLSNLLNNAARYTDPGGRIELIARREGGQAVVEVRDSGIGIAADQLEAVFAMFGQLDRSDPRSHGGLGIGLALAQSLAQMHGGSVEAASDGPGLGSRFTLRLPLAEPDAAGGDADPQRAGVQVLQPRRVLIVDDNADSADSTGMLLSHFGAEVRVVHDSTSGLAEIDAWRPEVVVLDLGMPGLDGYEVARRARARFGAAEMTLIALTGWGQQEDRERTRAAGFDHHLVKPVDPAILQALLRAMESP